MITLEELAPEHFERVAKWLSKRDISRWLTAEWRNKDVSPSLIAVTVRNRRNRLFLVLHEQRPCGLVALSDIETEDGCANVWYFLGEDTESGKGITTQAVRELARRAFGEMGFASLYAWAMEDNIASQRVLLRAGFREAGRLRQCALSGGRRVDRIYFDSLAEEHIGER